MFDIWNRIEGLKIDKSVCAILMVSRLIKELETLLEE